MHGGINNYSLLNYRKIGLSPTGSEIGKKILVPCYNIMYTVCCGAFSIASSCRIFNDLLLLVHLYLKNEV